MLTAGSNEEATQTMWLSILDFVNLSRALGLKLSTKGVIVAKQPSAVRTLVKALAQKGITYNTSETTRDLGIDFSFSCKAEVRKHILKHRIKKSKNMLNKIQKLAKLSRGARVLFSGAGYSKATWGFQPSGLSYKEWQQIEIAAANAAGFRNGRCRDSALCIAYGPTGHPLVRAIKELFVLWFKLFVPAIQNNQPILQRLPIAWNTIKANLDSNTTEITLENSFHKADGILSHIIIFLTALKWKPISFNTWEDNAGALWQVSTTHMQEFPVMQIIYEIIRSFHIYSTEQARKHYHGSSIGTEIAWHQTLELNRSLKNKKKFLDLAILETIQAGAAWATLRTAQVMGKSDICPLCNEQIIDEWHTYWTCPCLSTQHQDCKEIKDSQHLTDQLDVDQIAFYNRGILNQTDLIPHIDYSLSIGMCNCQRPPITHTDLWPSGYYFGDGSGGKFSKHPSLTRAGVGVHHVDLHHNPYFNASTPLPGITQTNNRAELYAVLLVTRHSELAGTIDFFTDSKITKDIL